VAFALTETTPGAFSPARMTRGVSGSDDETSKLVDRAKAGDRAALEELLEAVRPRAMAAALKVLRNQDDAKDAVQEAFVKIWRCLARFEGRSSLSTWVHRIVTNASLDLLRRNGRASKMAERTRQPLEGAACLHERHDRTPETALADHEAQMLVRTAITALPAPQRQAVELCDLEGYSYLEISEIAQCPLGTVMSRLHHARRKLASDMRAPLGDSVERFAA